MSEKTGLFNFWFPAHWGPDVPSAGQLIKATTPVRTTAISECHTPERTHKTFGAMKSTAPHQLEPVDSLQNLSGAFIFLPFVAFVCLRVCADAAPAFRVGELALRFIPI